jgi:hypothetical protein
LSLHMMGFVAIMLGLSLVMVLVMAVFIVRRRKRRLSTPEARYQRDIREIQLSTYLQNKPRPTSQLGADGLEKKYGGFGGLGHG